MYKSNEKQALEKVRVIANIEKRMTDLLEKINAKLRYPQEILDTYVKTAKQGIEFERISLLERKKAFKEHCDAREKAFKEHCDVREKALKERSEAFDKLLQEKSQGFPWLAGAYADFLFLSQMKEAVYLEHKKHPAPSSAAKVQEIAKKRRAIEKKFRISQAIIKYYQDLFPFLEDFLGDVDEHILEQVLARSVDEPIKEISETGLDPVRVYLSRLSDEEYKKLSVTERNQRALDIHWSRHKHKWEIGRDYERYIGYLYEKEGYSVYYQGILEGFDDLGRDLVCTKNDKAIIIQCKRWSKHKTIHEKHINQLLGTAVKYAIDHQDEKVCPMFYTSTTLSDRAKNFAKYLKVIVKENFPMAEYPSIKCNVSRRTGEKIYHLPFDQQYDKTLIEEERHECYVATVAEAEKLGFRRAWKWKGEKQEQ